jgi:hypothetical protein
MKNQIDTVRKTRGFLLQMLEGLSLEAINHIPDGFANNIAWNIGHLIAAQQGVCYKRAGLPAVVSDTFFDMYKPGSKPERAITAEELEEIKILSHTTLEQLEADYEKGLFNNYTTWTTRYGVELTTIEEAMQFIQYHEGLHTGYVMALRRVLAQQSQPA